MPQGITPVNITSSLSSGTWQDIDADTYAGNHVDNVAGVMVQFITTADISIGVRKNGSTDARTESNTDEATMCNFTIGVDASGIFEVYVSTTTGVVVWLMGILTQDEATFLTNGVNISPSTGSWLDVDISGSTGGDTALVAFVELQKTSTSGQWYYGGRMNGSTDSRYGNNSSSRRVHRVVAIAVDGSEIFEWFQSITATMMLVGWLHDNVTTLTNGVFVTRPPDDVWTDINLSATIPSGKTGGYFEVYTQLGRNSSWRKDDTHPDASDKQVAHSYYPWIEIDGDRHIEGYVQTVASDLYILGYTDDPYFNPLPLSSGYFSGMGSGLGI